MHYFVSHEYYCFYKRRVHSFQHWQIIALAAQKQTAGVLYGKQTVKNKKRMYLAYVEVRNNLNSEILNEKWNTSNILGVMKYAVQTTEEKSIP